MNRKQKKTNTVHFCCQNFAGYIDKLNNPLHPVRNQPKITQSNQQHNTQQPPVSNQLEEAERRSNQNKRLKLIIHHQTTTMLMTMTTTFWMALCSSLLAALLMFGAITSSALFQCCSKKNKMRRSLVVTRAPTKRVFTERPVKRSEWDSPTQKNKPKAPALSDPEQAKPVDSLTCGIHNKRSPAKKSKIGAEEKGPNSKTAINDLQDIHLSIAAPPPKAIPLGEKERIIKEGNLKKAKGENAVDPYPTISMLLSHRGDSH